MLGSQTQTIRCDVAVIGGGVSGVTAAIAAARQGMQVFLVEREEFLGGVSVSGLGLLGFRDRTGKAVINGIAQEIVNRLEKLKGTLGHNPCPILNSLTPINAALMRLILFEMCRESEVKLLLGCTPVSADIQDERLSRICIYGSDSSFYLDAKIYIDATGDGELCEMAGIPFEKGDSDGELQPASLIFSVSGICKEELLQYIDENPSEVETPKGYEMKTDPSFFHTVKGYNLLGLDALIQKARAAGDYVDVPRDRFSLITHPNDDTTVINNTRIIHFDGTDPWQLSRGTQEAFRQMEELIRFMPSYIPGYENCALSFVSPMLGVRETRRFDGKRRLCKDDILSGKIPPDTVALCGYNVDIHHGQDEGSELYIVSHAYGIPYGCMVPLKMKGLIFTGRTICVDRVAFGSSRIMSTCMAMGQAAGTAAALCIQNGYDPDTIPVEDLRSLLLKNGAVLTIPQEETEHEDIEQSEL